MYSPLPSGERVRVMGETVRVMGETVAVRGRRESTLTPGPSPFQGEGR